MFCNCAQRMYGEERQGSHNEDDGEGHHTKGHGISLQCSCTFGNIFFLCKNTCYCHLSYDRHEATKDKHDTTGIVPKPCVVAQSLKTRTIVGCRRCVFVQHLAQSVIAGIVELSALTRHKLRCMGKEIGCQCSAHKDDKRMEQCHYRGNLHLASLHLVT